MGDEKLYEVTTFIPENDNDGRPFPTGTIVGILNRLADLGDGANIDPGVTGMYRMPSGDMLSEPVSRVMVVMPESRVPEARALVEAVGRELNQVQMFFKAVPSDGVELLDIA